MEEPHEFVDSADRASNEPERADSKHNATESRRPGSGTFDGGARSSGPRNPVAAAQAEHGNQTLQRLSKEGAFRRESGPDARDGGETRDGSAATGDGNAVTTGSTSLSGVPSRARRQVRRTTGALPPMRVEQTAAAERKLDADDAVAAARGTRILARPGAFQGEDGPETFAHEVAHVLQQTAPGASHHSTAAAEADADAFAQSVADGGPASVDVSASVGWAYQSNERREQDPDDPVVALVFDTDAKRVVFRTESGADFEYGYTGSIQEIYEGEGPPSGPYPATRRYWGLDILSEDFEEGEFVSVESNPNMQPSGSLEFAERFSILIRGSGSTGSREPTDGSTAEESQGTETGEAEGETAQSASAMGAQSGWIQSEFLAQIRNILSEMRTLANILSFFGGVVVGASSQVSAEQLAKLDEKYLKAVAYWQFVHWDDYLGGLKDGLKEELAGIIDMIANVDELLSTAVDLVIFVVTEATPAMMREAGRQVGVQFGGEIEGLIDSSGGEFMRKLGELLGPLLFEVLVSLVTSGVGAAIKGSKIFGRILEKFPKSDKIRRLLPDEDALQNKVTSDGGADTGGAGTTRDRSSSDAADESSRTPERSRRDRDADEDTEEDRPTPGGDAPVHARFDASVRQELIEFWQRRRRNLDEDDELSPEDVDEFIDRIRSQESPHPTQAEKEIAYFYGKYGRGAEQRSFRSGREAEHGEEGSTRPDVTNQNVLVEVKQRSNLDPDFLVDKTITELRRQIGDRAVEGPAGINQTIVIDARGAGLGAQRRREIAQQIVSGVNDELASRAPENLPRITAQDIQFVTW